MKYLSKKDIYLYNDCAASCEFVQLCDYHIDSKIPIRQKENAKYKVHWNRRLIEKLAWRPTDFFLSPPDVKGKLRHKHHPLGITHHAIHYLMAERYLLPLNESPRMTLLYEAIASTSDIFFIIQFYNLSPEKHRIAAEYFKRCQSLWDITPAEWNHYMQKFSSNPFALYKKVAMEMYEFCLLVLEWCVIPYPTLKETQYFNQRLKKMQYRFFYEQYDIETFMTYVLGFCTKHSSDWDIEASKDLEAIFKNSKTMQNFIQQLAKPYVYKNKLSFELKTFAQNHRRINKIQ